MSVKYIILNFVISITVITQSFKFKKSKEICKEKKLRYSE